MNEWNIITLITLVKLWLVFSSSSRIPRSISLTHLPASHACWVGSAACRKVAVLCSGHRVEARARREGKHVPLLVYRAVDVVKNCWGYNPVVALGEHFPHDESRVGLVQQIRAAHDVDLLGRILDVSSNLGEGKVH